MTKIFVEIDGANLKIGINGEPKAGIEKLLTNFIATRLEEAASDLKNVQDKIQNDNLSIN